MKSALLPAVRIDPALRGGVEAALEVGETLSAFIEISVRTQVEHRTAQRAFLERGLAAEREDDWLAPAEVLRDVGKLASTRKKRQR